MNTLVDHQAAAWRLELQPGVEGLVKVYASKQGGEAVARASATARSPRTGWRHIDAVAAMNSTGTAVWARYVKGLDLPPLPETMTVSVPDYGPRPDTRACGSSRSRSPRAASSAAACAGPS
ncbi:hypothetical protein ACR6C2_08560 [Streptomyces sp. INA 01156]